MNQDKINYGKLSSYNLRDTDFIQAFMEEARQQQRSELLQIPELEIEQPDPRKSLEKLTMPTMSHTLKRKDNKQEVKTRQEIIDERMKSKQNKKPTLRFELPSPADKQGSRDARQKLLKRTKSTMTSSLSNQAMQDTISKSRSQKQLASHQKSRAEGA